MSKKAAREKVNPEKRSVARSSASNIVIAGVVCLAIGLGAGYYIGQQSAPATTRENASQPVAPLTDPSAFIQTEASLKSVLTSKPKDIGTLIELGNLYYDNARYRDAVDYYGRALDLDPKNPNVRTDRGTSYWNLGQADAAITEFTKSLEVNPTHAQTLYNLGVVYLHGKNDPDAARRTWEKLLASNPNYPERAKVQEQLASMSAVGTGPAAPAAPPGGNVGGVEDLLQRMKTSR